MRGARRLDFAEELVVHIAAREGGQAEIDTQARVDACAPQAPDMCSLGRHGHAILGAKIISRVKFGAPNVGAQIGAIFFGTKTWD